MSPYPSQSVSGPENFYLASVQVPIILNGHYLNIVIFRDFSKISFSIFTRPINS